MQRILGGIISIIGILMIVLLIKEESYLDTDESNMLFVLSLIITGIGILTVSGVFD